MTFEAPKHPQSEKQKYLDVLHIYIYMCVCVCVCVCVCPLSDMKLPWSEDDQLCTSSAEVKNDWSYTPTPPVHLHDVDRDNSTFTLHIFRIALHFDTCN